LPYEDNRDSSAFILFEFSDPEEHWILMQLASRIINITAPDDRELGGSPIFESQGLQ
tara:strand:- start:3850 stop:4020 length:171 start_codon:yes stop_codon:yes gene_type:complete